MLHPDQRIRVLREAGAIRRAHNVFHHGEYTVGLHSYNAATIILTLHPDPSMRLVKAILWHDAAERFLGDLPAPAKWYNPELARTYVEAEKVVESHIGTSDIIEGLSEDDRHWLHAADRLELLMWAQDQIAAGNLHVSNVLTNVLEWFQKNHERIPLQIRDYMFHNPKWTRTKEDIR